ncbi:ABC transporter permease [Teichococcus wenyumeiae]|uniref:ABC transporter permease n=1 Tax=Teichococcus wenyumeiae TaxID=2478470 RepID=UPI0013146517|nr:ABC transporter permease [Pseudoroseomonas wenyumeiae]
MSNATAAAPARASAERWRLSPVTLRWLCLAALVAVWEVAPRAGWVPQVILAPPSAALVEGLAEWDFFASALAFTFGEILASLIFAYGLGGLLGLVIGLSPFGRRAALPLVSSIYALPLIVIYPVMTAWFGIGPASKIWFASLYGIFPVILATAAGVQLVDRKLITMARAQGASFWPMMTEVIIPAALPAVVSGLRVGGALVTVGVVVAEMLASTDGIGFLITQNRTMFRTPQVYFGILLVLVLAGGLDTLISRLERRASRWRPLQDSSHE